MISRLNNNEKDAVDVTADKNPEEAAAEHTPHAAHAAKSEAAAQNASFVEKVQARKEAKAQAKKKKRNRVILAIVLTLLAVVLAIVTPFSFMLNSGRQNLMQQPEEVEVPEQAVTFDEGRTVEYNGETYMLNEDVVSICVIGSGRYKSDARAGRAGESDAVMVLALDTKTGKTTAIGIPRDSMVEVGEYVGTAFMGMETMQLCLAYSYGDGAETSCEYVTTIAQRVLYNMPINYYFAIEMEGVGPMADAIGGVSLTALEAIPAMGIKEGDPVTLHGNQALDYVQLRDRTQLESSLGRQERQAQFLNAYASQVLIAAKSDITVVSDLFEIAKTYSTTNLTVDEYMYLASCMLGNGITSLDVLTLEGEMQELDGHAAFYLDKDFAYQTVLDVYYTMVGAE